MKNLPKFADFLAIPGAAEGFRAGLAGCKTIKDAEQEAQNMVIEMAAEMEKGMEGKIPTAEQKILVKQWMLNFMDDFQAHFESEIGGRKHLRPFPLAIAAVKDEIKGGDIEVKYLLQKWRIADFDINTGMPN